MAEQITLRPANRQDAEMLACLWARTFPDKFGPILGEKAEAVLSDWLRLSERHLQTTTVAEIEGTVVGFVVIDAPATPRPDDGRWLWRALQLHNGIFGALRGLILMALVDSNHQRSSDEVYIEMLGVAPGWRGRGIARALMGHAEAVAKAAEATWLTLEVVSDNRPAIQLYEKQDFEIRRERRSTMLRWVTGHPGYFEMAKVIEAV
jgi:ribosomal protein S18 acetylase RimI-like enzyme